MLGLIWVLYTDAQNMQTEGEVLICMGAGEIDTHLRREPASPNLCVALDTFACNSFVCSLDKKQLRLWSISQVGQDQVSVLTKCVFVFLGLTRMFTCFIDQLQLYIQSSESGVAKHEP